jgi:hypothetical protein
LCLPQAVQVAPFGPSSTGKQKMPQAVFGSDKRAALDKIAAARSLKMIHLAPRAVLNNPAGVNSGDQRFKLKIRTQRAGIDLKIGEFSNQIILETGTPGCLAHKRLSFFAWYMKLPATPAR